MNKKNTMLAALTAFGILAVSSSVFAGGSSSPFEPRNPNFDYSMCADFMMVGDAAPVSKTISYGTPIDLPATYMCECVKYQVGAEAMDKIVCPQDLTNGF